MVVFYKDLAKAAENILNDDYDFSRKLKIQSTTTNGVKFTTEGEMSSNKTIIAKLSTGFTHHDSGVVFKKLQVTTNGHLITEAELPNAFTKGLKLIAKVEDNSISKVPHTKRVAILGAEYVKNSIAFNCQVNSGNKTIHDGIVYRRDNIQVGAQSSFSIDKTAFDQYNVGATYTGSDYAATLQTKNKFGAVSASFHHHINHRLVYSGLFNYDLKSGHNRLVAGCRYKADASTTYAGKICSDGHISLVLLQKINPNLTLSTSAHIDAKSFEGDSHKFGMGLTVNV